MLASELGSNKKEKPESWNTLQQTQAFEPARLTRCCPVMVLDKEAICCCRIGMLSPYIVLMQMSLVLAIKAESPDSKPSRLPRLLA